MKSALWLATLAAAAISLPVSGCTKQSDAERGKYQAVEAVPEARPPVARVEPVKPADPIAAEPQKPADPIVAGNSTKPEPREVPPPKGKDPKQPPSEPKEPKAPPAPPAPPSTGQNVDRPTYQIKVAVASTYPAGKPGTVDVSLTPKSGWKVNLDFPTKLEITAPAGVTMASTKLKKEDAASFGEKGAAFRIAFTPTSAGRKSFAGKFKFVICNDDSCDPSTEELSWQVAVQ